MEWIARTEVLFGKCLAGQISPHAIEPGIMQEPFNHGILALRDKATEADLMDVIGMVALDQAKVAAKNINGKVEEYVAACRAASVRVRTGNELAPIVTRWQRGDNKDGDMVKAQASIGRMDDGKSFATLLGDAPELGKIWRKSYYSVWDRYFKGLPESSMVVLGAPPKTGKTSLLGRLHIEMAKKQKPTLFFSLEMTLAQVKTRFKQLDPTGMKTKKNMNQIIVVDQALTLSEIYAEAGRIAAETKNLHMISVDFVNMIVPERTHRGQVEQIDDIYRTLAALAKQLDVPVLAVSQLNASYIGGRPRVNHLRGSRLIEALAAQVVLVYNPRQIDVNQEDEEFYQGDDVGWLILGASRYGFSDKGPIAVATEWRGEKGWGDATGHVKHIFAV